MNGKTEFVITCDNSGDYKIIQNLLEHQNGLIRVREMKPTKGVLYTSFRLGKGIIYVVCQEVTWLRRDANLRFTRNPRECEGRTLLGRHGPELGTYLPVIVTEIKDHARRNSWL